MEVVCAGLLADVRCWLDHLLSLGPSYGYFPEPCKCYLVVAPRYVGLASDVFAGLGITIISGHPFLGGLTGEPKHCEELHRRKVTDWVHSVHALALVAKKSPRLLLLQW